MRTFEITRTEGEALVELLEDDCDPKRIEQWRFDLAEIIRLKFGMVTRDQERQSKVIDVNSKPLELCPHQT